MVVVVAALGDEELFGRAEKMQVATAVMVDDDDVEDVVIVGVERFEKLPAILLSQWARSQQPLQFRMSESPAIHSSLFFNTNTTFFLLSHVSLGLPCLLSTVNPQLKQHPDNPNLCCFHEVKEHRQELPSP